MGELAMSPEREREKKKNAICSYHLRLSQQPRAAHALRSDQDQLVSGYDGSGWQRLAVVTRIFPIYVSLGQFVWQSAIQYEIITFHDIQMSL